MTTIDTITHIKCSCGQIGNVTLHEEGQEYLRRTVAYSVSELNWQNPSINYDEALSDDELLQELKIYCPDCGDRITARHVVDFEI